MLFNSWQDMCSLNTCTMYVRTFVRRSFSMEIIKEPVFQTVPESFLIWIHLGCLGDNLCELAIDCVRVSLFRGQMDDIIHEDLEIYCGAADHIAVLAPPHLFVGWKFWTTLCDQDWIEGVKRAVDSNEARRGRMSFTIFSKKNWWLLESHPKRTSQHPALPVPL